jgi:hypothetical protein
MAFLKPLRLLFRNGWFRNALNQTKTGLGRFKGAHWDF